MSTNFPSLGHPVPAVPGAYRFAHQAMAATFEILTTHSDVLYAEQAAWAAFELLDRLEQELSRYVENSDISRINSLAADQPVAVSPAALECLEISARIHMETAGAFDVTAGCLVGFWRGANSTAQFSGDEEFRRARRQTGIHLVQLNKADHTVRLRTPGLRIDLGGIGKGYALDRMAQLLHDWEINDALIQSGQSTALAIGKPAKLEGWPVSLMHPDSGKEVLGPVNLYHRAISGSGLQKGPHIIDPRTARPAVHRRAAWSAAPEAALADALSTAFMIMTRDEIQRYCTTHPDVTAILALDAVNPKTHGVSIRCYGRDL